MSEFPELPDYFTLRLGADLSSAIRGQPVWFNYGAAGLEITEPPPSTTPPPPIPVQTPLSAHARPMVQSAKISAKDRRSGKDLGSITIPGDTCSALFWSESAVEKFLLPYYVSAGGQQAYRVLHAINQAWYAYEECTTVVALAFSYPSQPFATSSVQLWDTVSVISGNPSEGGLHMKSLREFLGSQPAPQPPEPLDHPPFRWESPIAPNPPADTPIDSVGAREVAEYVSGFREQIVNVYETDSSGGLEPTLTPIGDGPPLFTAWTRKVRPERPEVTVTLEVTTIILGMEMTTNKELTAIGGREANVPDSVFWTDGAIEMLVLPYYASVEGHGAPWYLALILGKWSGVIPTGILDAALLLVQIMEKLLKVLLANPAGVVGRLVERLEGETEAVQAGAFDSDVYGLVHLPNSEWIDQTELIITSIFLEHRTWLLASDGDHPLVSPGRRLVPRRRVTA